MKNCGGFFAIVALVTFTRAALACVTDEQSKYSQRAQTFTPSEVCGAIVTGITGVETTCEGNKFNKDQIRVAVTRTLNNEIVEFDAQFIAPSEMLSEFVGKSGYESHKYKILFFLDFNCRNMIWTYTYEPRYIKHFFDVSGDLNNPNWTLYSDVDRLQVLDSKFRGWIVDEISKPFR